MRRDEKHTLVAMIRHGYNSAMRGDILYTRRAVVTLVPCAAGIRAGIVTMKPKTRMCGADRHIMQFAPTRITTINASYETQEARRACSRIMIGRLSRHSLSSPHFLSPRLHHPAFLAFPLCPSQRQFPSKRGVNWGYRHVF
jgi:hypothetical protein